MARYSIPTLNMELKAAGVASVGLLCACIVMATVRGHPRYNKLPIASPQKTILPNLSPEEVHGLPYPPDILPGARDVETPYGSIRVYEWGPLDGPRVLLVHGISTPSISLGPLAEQLAHHGCRVMLFDLFGRGYSDGVADLAYDNRLYTSQIFLALSSSTITWIRPDDPFAMIGYSLGGGLSADFTSYFPHLVSSLVLIAPSGLLRAEHISAKTRFFASYGHGLISPTLIHWLFRRRLYSGAAPATVTTDESTGDNLAAQAEAGSVQLKQDSNDQSSSRTLSGHESLFPSRPQVTVNATIDWQLTHHPGFVSAYLSSLRYAPVHDQHPRWQLIGERLFNQKARLAATYSGEYGSSSSDAASIRSHHSSGSGSHSKHSSSSLSQFGLRSGVGAGLKQGKVLLILGETDPIIIKDEIVQDAQEALGGSVNVEVVVFDAGHEVPISKTEPMAEIIMGFWTKDETASVISQAVSSSSSASASASAARPGSVKNLKYWKKKFKSKRDER